MKLIMKFKIPGILRHGNYLLRIFFLRSTESSFAPSLGQKKKKKTGNQELRLIK